MRILIMALAAVLVLLQARLWISEAGCVRSGGSPPKSNAAPRRTVNSRLAIRRSQAEVVDLKQGVAAAEERARTELGMIQSGETFYQIAPEAPESRQPR